MVLAVKSHPEDRDNRFSRSVAANPYSKITSISGRAPRPLEVIAEPTPAEIVSHAQDLASSLPKKVPSPERVVRFQTSAKLAPPWLKWLVALQRGSSAIGFCLVSATLTVYGNTVYSQQKWDSATDRLNNLHRDERQLDLMTEALKYQIAQQTEQPGTGLIPQQPSNFLVVRAAALRPAPPSPASRPAYFSAPKGY